MADLRIPTTADVERIQNQPDPVIRNLQITQCYYELARVLYRQTGPAANWCTFATWASKQAGQTIRKQDFIRLLDRSLITAPDASFSIPGAPGSEQAAAQAVAQDVALEAAKNEPALERASAAVALGNRKVFAEIGAEFARFYAECFVEERLDPARVEPFCAALRPGPPPDGQEELRQAFRHYARAILTVDSKQRAEWLLLANLEIGLHEQTRLQPEIALSMDAGWLRFFDLARPLFRILFPANGIFHLLHLYIMRLLGRPTGLDASLRGLVESLRLGLRQLITETMMTIALPSGVVLSLARDVPADVPAALRQVQLPELRDFLRKHGLAADGRHGSGTLDWADLPDRMNYINSLFRCYQEYPGLFEPPFSEEQVQALQAGQLPEGRL